MFVAIYRCVCVLCCRVFCFFFNDTATTEIYTLSLHDALPICVRTWPRRTWRFAATSAAGRSTRSDRKSGSAGMPRPISYAVFCLKKKNTQTDKLLTTLTRPAHHAHYLRLIPTA